MEERKKCQQGRGIGWKKSKEGVEGRSERKEWKKGRINNSKRKNRFCDERKKNKI